MHSRNTNFPIFIQYIQYKFYINTRSVNVKKRTAAAAFGHPLSGDQAASSVSNDLTLSDSAAEILPSASDPVVLDDLEVRTYPYTMVLHWL